MKKFDFCIGNPPYQGDNHQQLYPSFYLAGQKISNCVEMIFPIGWQEPKNANNLGKLNNPEVKEDERIVFIDNRQNVFPGVLGAEWTNVIMWKEGYDNGLNGKQNILTNGENPQETRLVWDKKEIKKPKEITELAILVMGQGDFIPLQTITSVLKPYGLRTDVFERLEHYNLPPMRTTRMRDTDIKIFGAKGEIRFVPSTYPLPKKTSAFNKYKVFVPYAWGNMAEKTGLGGAFSNIIIGEPTNIVTETYLESGCFDSHEDARKHAKYLATQFARALLYFNKTSQHSTSAWGAIPIQSYSEEWWDKSIAEIDDELFKKYEVPQSVVDFVKKNIQVRTEENIINFEKGGK